MTSITIYKNKEGAYKGFQTRGHAGAGEYGEDIVCASISVLTINTVNAIEKLTSDSIHVTAEESTGLIQMIFQEEISHDASLLMDAYYLGVVSVEEQYGPDYIQVTCKEV